MDEVDHRLSRFFDALSNGVRLQIVELLHKAGTLCVSSVVEELERTQQSISRQLKILRYNDLVEAETDGGFRYYTIKRPELIEKALEIKPLLERDD